MASSREQSKTAYDLLTQYRLAIFGLAALWIYCRHTIHNYDYTYLQPFQSVFNIGDAGVDVFLFLSGFGLYFSLQKNSSALVFYKKRLLRILPSFLLFSIVLCFERGTFQRVGWNPLLCLKSLFSGWWYVVFILFAYAFTPPY
jgi:peptidoglycan/LPS O-acetylase OafA/YrhL